MNKNKTKIIEVKFKAKSQIMLETNAIDDLNYYCITIENKSIMIIQKY